MTANVLRMLDMIATPVSQRIGVLMHAAASRLLLRRGEISRTEGRGA